MPGSARRAIVRCAWPLLTALALCTAAPAQAAPLRDPAPQADAKPTNPDIYGWFAFDIDRWGPQLSFGASHIVDGPFAIASTVWMNLEAGTQHAIGELDLGPELLIADSIRITLQFGLGFDFTANELQYFSVPLYLVADLDALYLEAWNFLFLYDPLYDRDDPPEGSLPPTDSFAGRYALLYKPFPLIAVGPQVELSVIFKNATINDLSTVASLPLGMRIDVDYGQGSRFGAFLAYETRPGTNPRDSRLVGRLSYSHVFF